MTDTQFRFLVKPVVFIICLFPLAALFYRGQQTGLGANPVEAITQWSGEWTLRFLLITLAITPARRLTKWQKLIRLRRMLGLYAYFYATLHFLTLFWFDHQFDFLAIVEDVLERPFITVGFLAWLLMLPLAITSNKFFMRRLGSKWQSLHRWIYIIALFGVLHFFWLVKADNFEPLIYLAILLPLFLYRFGLQLKNQAG